MFQAFFSKRTKQQNRKILEELQMQKKQLLLKQVQPSTLPGSLTPAVGIATTTQSSVDAHALSTSQRTALQHAHANSVGWFITQESSFGNLILPVLPRFDKQQ
ncbi:SOSS complex subunit C-like isoform X3 [Tachypleus tridentatus]|uniref:SOSS complex subunit C-like isoform X3 n=1 Tax=Tachypleus tridentatus TaxID=6853 RepID=UPI003FD439F0